MGLKTLLLNSYSEIQGHSYSIAWLAMSFSVCIVPTSNIGGVYLYEFNDFKRSINRALLSTVFVEI